GIARTPCTQGREAILRSWASAASSASSRGSHILTGAAVSARVIGSWARSAVFTVRLLPDGRVCPDGGRSTNEDAGLVHVPPPAPRRALTSDRRSLPRPRRRPAGRGPGATRMRRRPRRPVASERVGLPGRIQGEGPTDLA